MAGGFRPRRILPVTVAFLIGFAWLPATTAATECPELQPSSSVDCLRAALGDPEESKRSKALTHLRDRSNQQLPRELAPGLIAIVSDEATREASRETAIGILETMGSRAISAVESLRFVSVSSHESGRLRVAALRALGAIGLGAQATAGELLALLHSPGSPPELAAAAAEALIRVRRDLAAQDDVIAVYRSASNNATLRRALRRVFAHTSGILVADAAKLPLQVRRAKSAEIDKRLVEILGFAEDQDDEVPVRQSRTSLEYARPNFFATLYFTVAETPGMLALLTYVTLVLVVSVALFCFFPIFLLRLNEALRASTDFQLPAWLGGVKIAPRYLLGFGLFASRPRVLDAWVFRSVGPARQRFESRPTVAERSVHVTLPVAHSKGIIPAIAPANLRTFFDRRIAHLVIHGEGGAGKTSLACRMGRWAMAADLQGRLAEHLMLPVLIEDELPETLLHAIRRQLQELIDTAVPPSEGLVTSLLRRQRVLVIVDGFSEMSDETRQKINPASVDFPVNALIVTSRSDEQLGGVNRTVLRPRRLHGNYVSAFLSDYLTGCGKRELFTDPEFFDACRRLTVLVGDRNITALMAKLYADHIVAVKEGEGADEPPRNLAQLMLSYLNHVNRRVSHEHVSDRSVHQSAKALAWACVRANFYPSWIPKQDALRALSGSDAEKRLDYLETRLRILETAQPDQNRVRFLLDPLAEHLAALYLVETHVGDEERWWSFLRIADAQSTGSHDITGLLLAVRECCLAEESEAIHRTVAEEINRRVARTALAATAVRDAEA